MTAGSDSTVLLGTANSPGKSLDAGAPITAVPIRKPVMELDYEKLCPINQKLTQKKRNNKNNFCIHFNDVLISDLCFNRFRVEF